MSKFRKWEELRGEFNFTPEEEAEMEFELEIIQATIDARKKANLTQRELSEKTGIIQPTIARIEKRKTSPQTSTLIKLLYPLGYTLKVVPLQKRK